MRTVIRVSILVIAVNAVAGRAVAQPAPDDHSVLILGASVNNPGQSLEEAAARALGYTVVVDTNEAWRNRTSSHFATFRAIVLGDQVCSSSTSPNLDAALANRTVWSPAVTGNIIVIGTDPSYHSSHETLPSPAQGDILAKSGIAFAAAEPGKAGAYIALSCYYEGAAPHTPVPVLDGFGRFTVTGVSGCFDDAHIVAVHPALAGLTDESLSHWECSVHEAFDSFPSDFLPLVIARNEGCPSPPGTGINFGDLTCGTPYVLARGVRAVNLLTLVKVVTNNNGGTAGATDFTLSAAGPTPISGPGTVASDSIANFTPGTYTLSETGPPGYTASAWVCVGGTQSGSNVITVSSGNGATCTITNDDDAPKLTLVKVVTNDNGGTAVTTEFTLTATGPTSISGAGGVTSTSTFRPGTYTLSETTAVQGYTSSGWVCVGGTQAGSNITLQLGESATCTITNNDNPPSLTLVKVVTNDNGGTAVATDFTLRATGPTSISGAGGAASDATFDAGTYVLTETGAVPGYTASTWVCVGGTQVGNNITLQLGEGVTCTITNDDNPASLTVVKRIVNDNSGTALIADFGLTTTAGALLFGAGVPDGPNTLAYRAATLTGLSAGSKTLVERDVAGYTEGTWSCVGNTGAVGTSATAGSVVLANGENVTCTITNDDTPPPPNKAPLCQAAVVHSPRLWPPNHKFVDISVGGVTDPDGDRVTIRATSIRQDEVVLEQGKGAGHTSPDATLSPIAVRAERNGNPKTPGDGRVYHISFTAKDGKGGSCTGVVTVCVPHDQGRGAKCVDGGPLYSSIPWAVEDDTPKAGDDDRSRGRSSDRKH